MLHLHDRASMAHALTLPLDPQLRGLLLDRFAALRTADYDLTDDTEFVILQRDDSEADLVRCIGFSPLIEPIDGARFGGAGFHPCWDHLTDHGGWFEVIYTFGSSFAYVLFISAARPANDPLAQLCLSYA